MIKYYDGLQGTSSASGVYSDWHQYNKEIFAGCTISVILFLAEFTVIQGSNDLFRSDSRKFSPYFQHVGDMEERCKLTHWWFGGKTP